jgi:hypothetical protein
MFNQLKEKIKTKLFGNSIKIPNELLYSYLFVYMAKYKLGLDIYLLQADQNTYCIMPNFLISYKNKIISVPINVNYYELTNVYGQTNKIPQNILLKLNDFLTSNRNTILDYYEGKLNRVETITLLK